MEWSISVTVSDALEASAVFRLHRRDVHGHLLRVDAERFRSQSGIGNVRIRRHRSARRSLPVPIVAAPQAAASAGKAGRAEH